MLINEPLDVSDPKYDNNLGNKCEILHRDCDITLVIRNSFLTLNDDLEKNWWCHSIFHSISIVKEKVCGLIIDNISCKNILFACAMKKLKMITENHFKLYKTGMVE